MKAMILAAGEGRRLRPLTLRLPKCLMPVGGRPLLDHWLETCRRYRVDEVLINGHYLAERVEAFVEEARSRYPFVIRFAYEPHLLGTAGTVRKNFDFIRSERFFLLCHGDNYTDIDLDAFVAFHQERQAELSLALFQTDNPGQCGIVERLDERGRIEVFVEKPENPQSNLASAAIFLLSPRIVEGFPDQEVIDFSRDVIPRYQGRMYGFQMKGFNIDIGTRAALSRANRIAAGRAGSAPV